MSVDMRHGVRDELLETAELVAVDSLAYFPGNARLHDDDVVARSLRRNGQYRAIVVRRPRESSELGTGAVILAGNGTTYNARALGWTHIAVSWVDCDDATARRINLVDNRASDLAKDDPGDLAKLLAALGDDFDGTGWTPEDYAKLLDDNDDPLTFGDADTDDSPHAYGVVVTCDSEQQQTDLLDKLADEGFNVRALM